MDETRSFRGAVGAPEPWIASRGTGGHEVETAAPDGEAARIHERQRVDAQEGGRSGAGPVAAPELAGLIGNGTGGEQEAASARRNLDRQGDVVVRVGEIPRQQE